MHGQQNVKKSPTFLGTEVPSSGNLSDQRNTCSYSFDWKDSLLLLLIYSIIMHLLVDGLNCVKYYINYRQT